MPVIRCALAKLLSAVFRGTKIDLRFDAGRTFVAIGNQLRELWRVPLLYQIYGASAETTPAHPAADKSGQALRRFHHHVQLAATHLVKIAQAVVRLAHQFADLVHVALSEGAGSIQSALVFMDDMAAALRYR